MEQQPQQPQQQGAIGFFSAPVFARGVRVRVKWLVFESFSRVVLWFDQRCSYKILILTLVLKVFMFRVRARLLLPLPLPLLVLYYLRFLLICLLLRFHFLLVSRRMA